MVDISKLNGLIDQQPHNWGVPPCSSHG
jgi:hypothetical protein